MDNKESVLIDRCLTSFYQNTFVEMDVYLLLILLRQHSKKNSIVFELANFVAHRERDRGMLHKYILETKLKAEKIGVESTTIVIKERFKTADLFKDINQILLELEFLPLPNEISNEIMVCVISLLQDVKLVNNNKIIGHLVLAISKDEIELMGSVKPKGKIYKTTNIKINFPVLKAENIFYTPITKREIENTVLTVRDASGKLVLTNVAKNE